MKPVIDFLLKTKMTMNQTQTGDHSMGNLELSMGNAKNSLENLENLENSVVVYPDAAITFAVISCVILILLGVLGNSMTIFALLNHRKLRHVTTSIFIVSLCVTDLIFCAFNLPLTAVRYAYQNWILSDGMCEAFALFFVCRNF